MFCQNNLNNARLAKNWVARDANSAQLYTVNITKHKQEKTLPTLEDALCDCPA